MTPGQTLGAIIGVLCVVLPLLGVALLVWWALGWIYTPRVGVAVVRTGGLLLDPDLEGHRPGKVSRGGWILAIPRLHVVTQVPLCAVTTEWFGFIPDDVSTANHVEKRRLIEVTATVQVGDSDTSIKSAAMRLSPYRDVTTDLIQEHVPLETVSRAILWDYNEDHNHPADFAREIRKELDLAIHNLGLQVIDLRVVVTDARHTSTSTTVEPLNDILP